MTDERFLQLHSQYMNRHYRTALYLLGDREAAAAAAEQSWLHCCLQDLEHKGEEAFHQALCQELVSLCRPRMETLVYQPNALLPGGRGNRSAAEAIAALPTQQRLALVLVSVARCQPEWTAELLGLSAEQLRALLRQATVAVLGQEAVPV